MYDTVFPIFVLILAIIFFNVEIKPTLHNYIIKTPDVHISVKNET